MQVGWHCSNMQVGWICNDMPIYCHTCDQDLDLPVAGKGRCPCYDCAVLFDNLYEYQQRQMKDYPNLRGYAHMPKYDPKYFSQSGSESDEQTFYVSHVSQNTVAQNINKRQNQVCAKINVLLN